MFMEYDIPRGEKNFSFKVVNTISLLAKRIADENTTPCTIVKFVIGGKVCGIT
jgi:hypothetical protein